MYTKHELNQRLKNQVITYQNPSVDISSEMLNIRCKQHRDGNYCQDGDDRVIAYASKSVNKSNINNYTTR